MGNRLYTTLLTDPDRDNTRAPGMWWLHIVFALLRRRSINFTDQCAGHNSLTPLAWSSPLKILFTYAPPTCFSNWQAKQGDIDHNVVTSKATRGALETCKVYAIKQTHVWCSRLYVLSKLRGKLMFHSCQCLVQKKLSDFPPAELK